MKKFPFEVQSACALDADGCCLYTTRSWGIYDEAEFWADSEGRLLRGGVATRWSARDLTDTGRTEQYPKPILH